MSQTPWPQDRVDTLTILWKTGLSAGRIALELGEGITRNAVMGQVHRLGLVKRNRTQPPKEMAMKRKPYGRSRTFNPKAPIVAQPPAPAVELKCEPVSLLELTSETCRWPLWDADLPDKAEKMMFCGARPMEGLAYCLAHCAIAYRAPGRTLDNANGGA